MRDEYDFFKGKRNPYARDLKRQVATDADMAKVGCKREAVAAEATAQAAEKPTPGAREF
jgi:hypothetical protein